MKNTASLHSLKTIAGAFIALVSLVPLGAQARGFSTAFTGRNGGVYTRQVSQTPGSFSATGSATLPNGQTASRSVISQKTDTGRTTNATATGFNGKTATYQSTATKTDSGYTRQATSVGPNGATATTKVSVSGQSGYITRTVTTSTTPPKS